MNYQKEVHICLSVILIDSVFRTGKNYYLQAFLEWCKYVIKEKKIPKYIIDDIEISTDSDEENSDKEILMKKRQTEKISYGEKFWWRKF